MSNNETNNNVDQISNDQSNDQTIDESMNNDNDMSFPPNPDVYANLPTPYKSILTKDSQDIYNEFNPSYIQFHDELEKGKPIASNSSWIYKC